VKSDPPSGTSLVGELGSESGMTPLHLASYSGNENVVRLLLNSAGVQVEAATTENVLTKIYVLYKFSAFMIMQCTVNY
jgi:ankyrin repeat protein